MNYHLTPEDIEAYGRQTELPHESQRKFLTEYKPNLPMEPRQRAIFDRQMALYYDAYVGAAEQRVVASYALRDVDFTMEWWKRFAGEPVLVNKLRGRATQTLFSLNYLVHPETIAAMTPPTPTVTSQPLYDDDWRAYGCGCVR